VLNKSAEEVADSVASVLCSLSEDCSFGQRGFRMVSMALKVPDEPKGLRLSAIDCDRGSGSASRASLVISITSLSTINCFEEELTTRPITFVFTTVHIALHHMSFWLELMTATVEITSDNSDATGDTHFSQT